MRRAAEPVGIDLFADVGRRGTGFERGGFDAARYFGGYILDRTARKPYIQVAR